MKTVIYQFWDGKVRDSVHAGVANMKKYAKYVGADYVFEDNPRWIKSLGMDFWKLFRTLRGIQASVE